MAFFGNLALVLASLALAQSAFAASGLEPEIPKNEASQLEAPPRPVAPKTIAECSAFAKSYQPVLKALSDRANAIKSSGPQVHVGPCCVAWTGGANCTNFESVAKAQEEWFCAAVDRDRWNAICRREVYDNNTRQQLETRYSNAVKDIESYTKAKTCSTSKPKGVPVVAVKACGPVEVNCKNITGADHTACIGRWDLCMAAAEKFNSIILKQNQLIDDCVNAATAAQPLKSR